MANQQEAGKWPEDFDDSQFKNGSKIKQFLITFIKNFISVLQEMSNMLELQIELKSGIIADSTSQFLDGIKSFLLAVSHDGLYNIAKGNEIIQRLIDEITERRDRKFIKKIIDRLTPNKDSIKLAISIMACDLVRIYEQQISIISGYSDNYYVKKFANDMVKVIIRYILNEEDRPPEKPTDIAKFVIPCLFNPNFAKKKWFKIKKGSELEIVLQENGKLKKINSPDLIINTGIRVKVNNSFKCYDLSHGGKIALYGFRQLSFFSIGNHKDIVNGINDITHQININDQSLYQYKSKLSGNLDMESFIHYAEQVLNVATQKDRFEITATVNDDQINIITTLLTEDISNLINDKMDTFKIYLKEAFGKEMKEMKEILEKIAKYQDLITNEKFILTNSIEEISKAFNIHTKKMIENLEKAGTERKQILALNLRIEQKLDGLVNQIQSNPTDASGLNQPNRNISQESDNLLKNFPIVPDSHYIRREKWITKICDQLKEIGTNGGQVLIYGSPGIGKTVAVAQAVERSVIELGHFQSYKAYWLDIGKINEDQLAEKLKSLYQILSGSKVFSNELPSILDNINRLFEEDKKVGNNLFVFDDIWHPSYYNYFKFAKKSIATSREINPNNKLQPSIEISEGFTDIEVREVFKKYEKIENAEICKEDPWIDDIIIASGGLPLAIGLIGGLGLRTNEQWKNALNSIRDAKCPIKIPNYENNLWGTVELSIKNLGEHEQKFRQLGAFKYPKVSIDSITSLWQCEKEVGQSILRKFHSKSLLKSLDYESSSSDNEVERAFIDPILVFNVIKN
ncbi:uncharacterized protein TRIADDRAFT_61449 [Trichoplax adhaerens]|uniref:NB-ARC domain-containing protein n=1 Tax=Trichoplax adhaerens TaxID=10228 RepID=B3SB07_TRIAD|nr:hypothetical protein TRIADDRAFT_61449 [Trichoplax adhaerens]EDV20025.1 hypothetical protein TRIADDRAFT_61449 [Trichoplax adhaerens]|eukprot:XP_002117409.1 hypothetical protein TRIADDRAFT_61449 [Trichoplax adhaerens]